MPRPGPEVSALAEAYRIGLRERPTRGLAGGRLGKGTGSSLEFQDRRDYSLGDDVRHLDWRAYARTDQLMVKLYREEIAPRVEVLLDLSRSMNVHPEKAQLACDLAFLLVRSAHEDGYQAKLVALGDRPELLPLGRLEGSGVEFEGRAPLAATLEQARPLIRAGSLRLFVSDFLFPHDAGSLLRPLALRAGGFAAVQVLSHEDAEPEVGRALRLVDAESDETLDLVLDPASVKAYRDRLARLTGALHEESRRLGAHFARLTTAKPLAIQCREELVPLSILEPA